MADPLKKVSAGEPLKIHAAAWNKIVDLVRPKTAFSAQAFGFEQASNIVLVANTSGQAVPLGGALRLERINFDAVDLRDGNIAGTDDEDVLLRAAIQRPVYRGSMPTATDPFAVALEPIATNGIGRMAIRGAIYFRMRFRNFAHKFATAVPGDCTQLQSTGCGPVQILHRYEYETFGDGKNAWGVM